MAGKDGAPVFPANQLQFRPRRGTAVTGHAGALIIGKVYRLQFPGVAARVIEPPPGAGSRNYPYLVESLILRSRWYVNERGEPDNNSAPLMVTSPFASRRRH
jgi:hypothetical protein